jgi:hypothetical protein
MPEKETLKRAAKDRREGKSPSTQAGEFVREEMHHIREGKHGAKSPEQAIAIGLSKARRAGVRLKAPARGQAKASTRRSAQSALRAGRRHQKPSAKRASAMRRRLKRAGHRAASHAALARHAHRAALRRSPRARSASARKAARTRASHR